MVLISLGALAIGIAIVALLAIGSLNQPAASLRIPPVAVALELRDGRSLGRADAPVSIEVYEDPQCPGCGHWSREMEPLLIASYIKDGTARLTYRDMAFLGPESLDAAVGMRAADQLAGKFWDFNAMVFENQRGESKGAFSRERLGQMAVQIGLDKAAFLALLDDPVLIAAVRDETAEGGALGIRSTPTVVIDGAIQPNVPTWDELKVAIGAALAAASPAAASPAAASPAASASAAPVPDASAAESVTP